jgi:hypothetical protein
MGSDEPIQLYASDAVKYSMVLWPGDKESSYLAIPDPEGRRKFKRKAGNSGEPPGFEEGLKKMGGLWARLQRYPDTYSLVTRPFPLKDYSPPTQLVVLGRDRKVAYSPIEELVVVRKGEYVVLPVDRESERQLHNWLDGLKGLSGDLREATLLNILDSGGLSSLKAQDEGKARESSRSFWGTRLWHIPLWTLLVLAVILGLAAGGAAGYKLVPRWIARFKAPMTRQASQAPPTPAAPPDTRKVEEELRQKFEESLRKLATMAATKRPEFKQLLDSHVAPFDVVPQAEPGARRVAEAWMLLKFAMLPKPGKVDLAWSAASNHTAADLLKKNAALLSPDEQKAIRAGFCSAGAPPPGDPTACTPDDLKATEAIEEIGKSLKAPPPPPPQQNKPGHGSSQQKGDRK